jgi:hypothetical protein
MQTRQPRDGPEMREWTSDDRPEGLRHKYSPPAADDDVRPSGMRYVYAAVCHDAQNGVSWLSLSRPQQ